MGRTMTMMSVAYLIMTYTMTTLLGPVGMVLANCCNMLVRIIYAVKVIQKTFQNQEDSPTSGLVPDTDILILLISAGATCMLSEIYLYTWSALVHLIIVVIMTLVVVVAIIVKEEYVLVFIAEKIKTLIGRGKVVTEQDVENKEKEE